MITKTTHPNPFWARMLACSFIVLAIAFVVAVTIGDFSYAACRAFAAIAFVAFVLFGTSLMVLMDEEK
jgi:hypothetical protein